MKKFFVALTMLAIFLTSSIALAAYEENIEEDADLTTIKTMAVAMPNFYKIEEKEPTLDEFTKAIYSVGRDTSAHDIISYEEIAGAIRRDTGVDIYSLDPVEAEKIYNANISKYADCYMVATVANNSGKPWLFFYVYNAADSKLLYTYSIQSKSIGKNAKDYSKAAESFYKQFDQTSEKNLSKEDRKNMEAKREAKAQKRKIKKITYRTGQSKADLVKKK